jgi:hypothetical protein
MGLDLPTPVSNPGKHAHTAMLHAHRKGMFASILKIANFGKITF